jgi:hypothetical protein
MTGKLFVEEKFRSLFRSVLKEEKQDVKATSSKTLSRNASGFSKNEINFYKTGT